VLCFTCIFSTCCLQYASVLQAGNIFQAINWLYFLYPPTKGNVLDSKCDKTHIHNTQYKPTAHHTIIMSLLHYYSPTVLFTTVLVLHQERYWLCYKNVINYAVSSAIFWDFTQLGMVILTTTVLHGP